MAKKYLNMLHESKFAYQFVKKIYIFCKVFTMIVLYLNEDSSVIIPEMFLNRCCWMNKFPIL